MLRFVGLKGSIMMSGALLRRIGLASDTMNKPTDFNPADHVEYDPLTGRFRKIKRQVGAEESPFWTKMGQPKKQPPSPDENDSNKKF